VYLQAFCIQMKKQKPRFLFKLAVVFLVLGYVLGSFANMLTIPRYVPAFPKANQASTMMLHPRPRLSDLQSVNPVKIFDRITLENDSPDKHSLSPKTLDLGFATFVAQPEASKFSLPQNHVLYRSGNIYLSLCTFRI
jgi:hypothetical protein